MNKLGRQITWKENINIDVVTVVCYHMYITNVVIIECVLWYLFWLINNELVSDLSVLFAAVSLVNFFINLIVTTFSFKCTLSDKSFHIVHCVSKKLCKLIFCQNFVKFRPCALTQIRWDGKWAPQKSWFSLLSLCQKFSVKFRPIVKIFGTKIAEKTSFSEVKTIFSEVYSFPPHLIYVNALPY